MNKEKLVAEARKVGWALNLAEKNGDIDHFMAKDVRYLIECINKLNEPEITEEQAWDKIVERYPADARSLAVAFEHFYYEGFSKKELPVIPKYVAEQLEYWERNKMNILWQFFIREIPSSILWWLEGEGNYDKMLEAAKYGYEVEKEKRYHVVNKENYFMLRKYDGLVDILHVSSSMSRDEYGKDTRFMLTEQEIKEYDERYWAFAEEVPE